MKKTLILRRLLTLLFAMFCLSLSCDQQVTAPSEETRLTIVSDEIQLAKRVHHFSGKDIPLYSADLSENLNHVAASNGFAIKLRAEVDPPRIDGHVVQASHVTFEGNYAFVAYHTVDNEYRGAVEIYDISNLDRPRLISQALFRDTDITIAVKFDDRVFLGGATDSPRQADFESPAVLETIPLRNHKLTASSSRVDLPSFNANDLDCFDNAIFVTTGTTGGALYIFDRHTLELSQTISLPAAKAIARTWKYIVVMEGTGTRLHLFNRSDRSFSHRIEVGCPNAFQAKAELDVDGDCIFLSAYTHGVKIVDVKSGKIKGSIAAPAGGVCNAVSVDGDLIFMADGKDGLQIGKIKSGDRFELLGRAKFAGSTNFVAARDDQVFVANGDGGLKILEIERK